MKYAIAILHEVLLVTEDKAFQGATPKP